MLPPLPRVELVVLRDRTLESRATGGFLNVQRVDLCARTQDGQTSRSFPYDVATRASLDAVVMAAWFRKDGQTRVYLRSKGIKVPDSVAGTIIRSSCYRSEARSERAGNFASVFGSPGYRKGRRSVAGTEGSHRLDGRSTAMKAAVGSGRARRTCRFDEKDIKTEPDGTPRASE